MARIRPISIFLGIVLLASSTVHAFDGKEHIYMSEIAFRVAVFRALRAAKADPDLPLDRMLTLKEITSAISSQTPLRYGDLVALVDAIKDIQPLFDSPGVFGYPKDASNIDWEHLKDLRSDVFRWAEAAHTNENHFQSGALTGHLLGHQQAISLATQGELVSALLVEAYADHFLEDFFAPGHVATPRSGYSDFASAASHDQYNHRGLTFEFRNKEELRGLITQVIAVLEDSDFLLPSPPDDTGLLLDIKVFHTLEQVVERGNEVFHGDSSLSDNREQAAFITTVVSHSIEEVFQAFLNSTTRNSFGDACFYFGYSMATEYVCGKRVAELLNLDPNSSLPELLRIARMHFGEFNLSEVSPIARIFNPLDLVLLSVYTEAPDTDVSSGFRTGVAVETMLFSYLPGRGSNTPIIFRHLPPALVVGLSRTWDYGTTLDGVHLRYIFALPRINTQLSIWSGTQQTMRRSAQQSMLRSEKIWRNISGVRAEMGFGLLYLHVGVEVSDTPNVRSGLTVMIPRSIWRK